MDKLTPGRKLILDLLAKSVAKVEAAEAENNRNKDARIEKKRKISVNVEMQPRKKSKVQKVMKENIILNEDKLVIKEEYTKMKIEPHTMSVSLIKIEDHPENWTRKNNRQKRKEMKENLDSNEDAKEGRKLILDLLAKSVAKVEAAEVENNKCKEEVKIEKEYHNSTNVEKLSRKLIKVKKENIIADEDAKDQSRIKKEFTGLKFERNPKSVNLNKTKNHPENKDKKERRLKKKIKLELCSDNLTKEEVKDELDLETKSVEVKVSDDKRFQKKNSSLKIEQIPEEMALECSDINSYVKIKESNVDINGHGLWTSGTQKHKYKKRLTGISLRHYKPEEDQILLDAVEKFGDQLDFVQLSKTLQRTGSSVRDRIKLLKSDITKRKQRYTLQEDLVILDAVLKHLGGQSLRMLNLAQKTWIEIGAVLGRGEHSPRSRWNYSVKPWILQHYSGTLNLDIRRPLANYLADHFEDINSIDWPLVARHIEFAGHTEGSLRLLNAKASAKKNYEEEDITLGMLAEFANRKYLPGSRVTRRRILERQTEIIEYFESYVKSSGN